MNSYQARIEGTSPDCLGNNLHAIQTKNQELVAVFDALVQSHFFVVSQTEPDAYLVEIRNASRQILQSVSIPPASVLPPPLKQRYKNYDPSRQWLVLFGIEALHKETLFDLPLTEYSPVIFLEPDPLIFLAWNCIRSYERAWNLPQLCSYFGNEGIARFLQDFDKHLEPYFAASQGFYLIPSMRIQQSNTQLSAFTKSAQQRFTTKIKEIQNLASQFLKQYSDPLRKSTYKVLILEPSVNCWLELGNGLASGFQKNGYQTIECRLPFPPSNITAYDSLQLLLHIQRTCPDFLVTISHSTDLFARGLEQVPLPRLVWYVDHPDNVLQYPHNPHDVLFPVWREFNDSLRNRGGRLGCEIPVGGLVIKTSKNPSFKCDVCFVGTVHDTSFIRDTLPAELNQKLDSLIQQKLAALQSPVMSLFDNLFQQHEERSLLLKALDGMRRPGMNDAQLLHLFLFMENMREYRLGIIKKLAGFNLKIFGNPDWEKLLKGTDVAEAFQGHGLTKEECHSAYQSAAISLSLHPTFPHQGPTLRDMDIPMCDGFLLSDIGIHIGDKVRDFFEPGREIALLVETGDIAGKVRYYLDNIVERKSITRAAKKRILEQHNYANRVKTMLEWMNQT